MNSDARIRILSRLHGALKMPLDSDPNGKMLSLQELTTNEKIVCLKQRMEGMRTEVHVVNGARWIDAFVKIVQKKGLGSLLYPHRTELGDSLEKHWEGRNEGAGSPPELIPYKGNVEGLKEQLFRVEAGITTTKGAIADAGAIILWPDENEPRLMSLVPPVHFAVLDADTIYGNLSEAMENENWYGKMPSNALLISGPSKTADIELTLAFGVHGPKELVLLIRNHK